MTLQTMPLHIEDYLKTNEDIQAFLKDMAENGTSSEFVAALGTAAKAKGMTDVAKKVGVTRASLYKSLSEDGMPRYETISRVVNALGFKMVLMPH